MGDEARRAAGTKVRTLVLVSHPIQYFAPVYRALAGDPRIDLEVLFHCRTGLDESFDPGFGRELKWDIPLLDGYRHAFLSADRTPRRFHPRVALQLLQLHPDVLLMHGYGSRTHVLALLVAKMLGIRVMVRGDTRLLPHHRLGGVKALAKRALFRLIDGFIAIGTLNAEFYRAHGVPPHRMFFAPFSVENAAFRLPPERRLAERDQIRKDLGIPADAIVILYASKMIALKRAEDLVRAFQRVACRFPDAWLLMAGSGPDEPGLHAMAQEAAADRIRFIGFQNQSQMPGCFAASDVFVLTTSGDAWGLVVNEAMAGGLPVIVSDQAGAECDLVRDRGTGIGYPCGDVDALAAALERMLCHPEGRERMARAAAAHIDDWDTPNSARAIADAVVAVGRRSPD